jgi:hypothetical protein
VVGEVQNRAHGKIIRTGGRDIQLIVNASRVD